MFEYLKMKNGENVSAYAKQVVESGMNSTEFARFMDEVNEISGVNLSRRTISSMFQGFGVTETDFDDIYELWQDEVI